MHLRCALANMLFIRQLAIILRGHVSSNLSHMYTCMNHTHMYPCFLEPCKNAHVYVGSPRARTESIEGALEEDERALAVAQHHHLRHNSPFSLPKFSQKHSLHLILMHARVDLGSEVVQ